MNEEQVKYTLWIIYVVDSLKGMGEEWKEI